MEITLMEDLEEEVQAEGLEELMGMHKAERHAKEGYNICHIEWRQEQEANFHHI